VNAQDEKCLEIALLQRDVEALTGIGERMTAVERKLDKWTGIFVGVWALASLFWGVFGGLLFATMREGMQDIRKTHDDVLIAVQRIGAVERAIDGRGISPGNFNHEGGSKK
jgi:hypothetical protein